VDLFDQAALVQQFHIASDRHVGHAQVTDELGHPDAAVLADAIEDVGLTLAR
jgi:hypothetical protein